MPTAYAAAHLRRLQHLLAEAQTDYDTLAYIILEGMVEVTVRSRTRTVTLPVPADAVPHLNGLLDDAALARVTQLEQEVVEAHNEVVQEADDRQVDVDQLAAYRQQARATPTN